MSSARRRSRELALQGLYQWQYTGADASQLLKNLADMDDYPQADAGFLESALRGVIGESEGLRAQLEPLADRKWEEVSPVERSILLLGAWELVHCREIPYRATLNEAIELGKRFGGTDGHKYVNGVLDRLAHAVRPAEVAAPRVPSRSGKRSPRSPGKKADA
jgi:transcription antitermination protein NusB